MARILRKKPERRILTLDISSYATGYAFWDGSKLLHYGQLKVKGDYSRLLEQGRLLKSILKLVHPDLRKGVEVWVETPFFSRSGSTDTPIKMAHGILLQACHDMLTDYCWNNVHVSTWRAALSSFKGVKGSKALKLKAMKVASRDYGIKIEDDNTADALCILTWARRYS